MGVQEPTREEGTATPPRTRVPLPSGIAGPFEVFVNGVPQEPGRDYALEDGVLVFARPLAREGRLGFWRWTSMLLGIAGSYGQNDQVDVVHQRDGRRVVETGLPLERA